ncbi:DUF721 domain-containing protein [Candidatus Fukatsuia symbiotica]|uniref:DUF721 domain-containing protein n=1 Tax=Candidatus Fukatsuia symbiotica TaxID=1878942 RepID=A0A2U8I6B9_9GAMM|nr:DUF721 domain-containing protein [Candidatus Fukatsuia symbiotica]AWK14647.1 hypothetical protein CCS41_09425 [Candidatus Fukatsuia symbiotica]MEA9444961.1 DUF721 domain-containing protein [Candidatus Fukatsuia symbiotica]
MRQSHPQLLNVLFDDTIAEKHSSLSHSQKDNSQPYSLHKVQQRTVALLKLNQAVQELLPPQLQPWCRVANYRQNILVLEVANASWMMALRYQQLHLLSTLRAQILASLSSIDIRINPALMAPGHNIVKDAAKPAANAEKPALSGRHLSVKSAVELRKLASRSPEKLRAILERFASLAGT